MITKILGTVLIVSGTSLFGTNRARALHTRYKNLIKINSGLVILENEIRYSKDFIDIILSRIASMTNMCEIFKTCANLPQEIPISKRWVSAVEQDSKSLHLLKSDTEILSILASELGMCDRDGQIANIRHVMTLLKKASDEAYCEYQKLSKLYCGLGILSGVFTSLILL